MRIHIDDLFAMLGKIKIENRQLESISNLPLVNFDQILKTVQHDKIRDITYSETKAHWES